MLMLRALRKRAVALLWCGQAMSCIGDEVYRVALIWLAVGLVGANTGYLVAVQSLAWLLVGMVAGSWADRWDQLKTMVRVDFLRALIVLVPVVMFHFRPISLPVLGLVAFSVAGLGAFFDPALMATIPRYSKDTESLKATTGLMATTYRLARAIGPSIIALLATLIPTIQFFTLDSLSFLVSAVSLALLSREPAHRKTETTSLRPPSFKESMISGFRAIQNDTLIRKILILKSVGGGLWALVYGLGTALLVEKLAPGNTRAYGLVVGSYGIGNLAGALVIGNMNRSRPLPLVFQGYLWLGIGFIAMGLSRGMTSLMIASAFSGFFGPMNDLPVVDMIQIRFPIHEIPRIFRIRMAGEIFSSLICMSIAPTLFKSIPIGTVIWAVGVVLVFFTIYGYVCLLDLEPEAA